MFKKIVCKGCERAKKVCYFRGAGRFTRRRNQYGVIGVYFDERAYKEEDLILCRSCETANNSAGYAFRLYNRIRIRHFNLTDSRLSYSFTAFWRWLDGTMYTQVYNKWAAEKNNLDSFGLKPTADRIDGWLGYELENMQVITQSENSSKGDKTSLGAKERTMLFFKTLRENLGLSKYEMARHLGMLPQTYYYYEDKARGCSFEVLCLIRRKLSMSWEDIGKLIDRDVKEDLIEKKRQEKTKTS